MTINTIKDHNVPIKCKVYKIWKEEISIQMFDKLISLLERPVLWQRSTEPFWDDEHISKGMLEAHLNPDWDAASRNHEFIDRSVEWIKSHVPENAKILDIGCGPGLYTKRLADMGYVVTGVDFSKRSIDYAKSQDSRSGYVYKNYLDLDYSDMFDMVMLIYCDYAALTENERKVLVKKVYKALKPKGLFILDVFTDKYFAQKYNRTSWTLFKNGGFWSADPYICLEANYLYENNTVSADQHIIITDSGIKEYLTWDTAFTAEKLAKEISPFKVKGMYDDVCGNPYTGEAETLCFVLETENTTPLPFC